MSTAGTEMFPFPLGEVTAYMPGGDERRAYGVSWGGPSAMVKSSEADDEKIAAWLARAPGLVMSYEQEIKLLNAKLRELRAAHPPRKVALLGDGCVRQDPKDPARLWLLNTAAKGWSAFGVIIDGGWDELFRKYDVIVSAPATDKHGQYWTVSPRKAGA